LVTTIGQYLLSLIENSDYIDSSISRIFTLKDELSGSNERTIRFDWALEKISNYDTGSLIFGNGFDYLPKMGKEFGGEIEDNPHNFILSTFLYGGVIGVILIVCLVYKLVMKVFLIKKYLFFISMLLVVFSLTSSNSLFSYRIFPIIVFLSTVRNIPTKLTLSSSKPQVFKT
jgi:hypothetical protein